MSAWKMAGKVVRLKFVMRDADLYSLRFRQSMVESGESRAESQKGRWFVPNFNGKTQW
jgi:hypothetical protein